MKYQTPPTDILSRSNVSIIDIYVKMFNSFLYRVSIL